MAVELIKLRAVEAILKLTVALSTSLQHAALFSVPCVMRVLPFLLGSLAGASGFAARVAVPARLGGPLPAAQLGLRRAAVRALASPLGVPPPNALKWVAGCVVAGFAGSVFVVPALGVWYKELRKPTWCPPGGVFGPAWTFLYASLGYSAALIAACDPRRLPLFYAHMAINLSWAPLFFGARRVVPAAYLNVLLCSVAAWNAASFYAASPLAGLLFAPYLAWCTFATALNFAIVRLNREPRAA